jgi:hypothetical protein
LKKKKEIKFKLFQSKIKKINLFLNLIISIFIIQKKIKIKYFNKKLFLITNDFNLKNKNFKLFWIEKIFIEKLEKN